MVPVKTIDAKNRPNDIPLSRWIEYDEIYHVNYIVHCLPQNVLGFGLYEKPLGEDCHPYKYFISTRFAIRPEDVQELMDMFQDIADALPDSVLQELLSNSNIPSKV